MKIDYFSDEEFNKIIWQKRRLLIIYFVILAIYLLASGVLLFQYLSLPYKSGYIIWVKLIEYFISALFVIFSFVFLLIPYKRVNDYYRALLFNKYGKYEESEGRFFETNGDLQVKDGVDMKSLIFIEWNKYDKDYHERKVLVYYEKPFPEIPENAYCKYQTQANVLLSYEIIKEEENNESNSNGDR